MTPKEMYEERKKARNRAREARVRVDEDEMALTVVDTLDRLATSFERIADALEARNA